MQSLPSRSALSRSLRRAARRRAARGFTLVELMVVVVLISILAVLAVPSMSTARDDRLAFDYARRIEQLIARGRARAAGRGAAHLFVAAPSGVRGKFQLFEALDGTPAASAGPNPVSSCKRPNEWTDAASFVPGNVSATASIIDGFDLDSAGVNTNADIRTQLFVDDAPQQAVVMCVSPNGATYVGTGANVAAAITNMQAQVLPFNRFMEVRVTRNRGGLQAGLRRRVLVAGTAAPRIKSE
ncbi:MAG: hypothetical protein JWP97_18 [Labilithrix sp.]|nr:hypothetical protein [Labilithrix sp.]